MKKIKNKLEKAPAPVVTPLEEPRQEPSFMRWLVLAGMLLFALLMFHVVLAPGSVLFSTDDNIGHLALRKAVLPGGLFGWWDDSTLLGFFFRLEMNLTYGLLSLLPIRFFNNWIHAIQLLIASFGLILFLRMKKLSWCSAVLGALAAFWLGSNLTLTYAGHLGKFGVLAFAGLFLPLAEQTARTRSLGWAVLTGIAIGGMFLEQLDVALFCAMFLFPYLLYALWREGGWCWKKGMLAVLIIAGVGIAVAFRSLSEGYFENVAAGASVTRMDANEKWNFITQWSWPPEECVDFIAPGYMGWRSGEPAAPYWGRMGQSAEWKATGQGFPNFKLENQYLGYLPFALVLYALWLALRGRGPRYTSQADAIFWGAVLLGSLLLSFGKYFPLYRVFSLLPLVSSIRNPNKFLHVFQIAWGILAAYGLEALLHAPPPDRATTNRRFFWVLAGLGGLLAFWALGLLAAWGSSLPRFAMYGEYAAHIVRTRCLAMVHAVVLAIIALFIFRKLTQAATPPRTRFWLPWALCLLVALDGIWLGRHYITTLPPSYIQENALTQFLKTRSNYQRSVLMNQAGIYNIWLTYLFPYNGIHALNVTQMPRMPADYQNFLDRVGGDPFRLWQLAGVNLMLAPGQIWGQLQQDPAYRDRFEAVFAYNVDTDATGNLVLNPGMQNRPGQHTVLRAKQDSPRFALLASWETVSRDAALNRLSARTFSPFSTALLSPAGDQQPPAMPPDNGKGLLGPATVKEYRPGLIRLQVSADRPAILRSAERYDPRWSARVNGQPATIFPCDYIFQGVQVPAGLQEVVLEFHPPVLPFAVSLLGWLIGLGAGGWVWLKRKDTPPAARVAEVTPAAAMAGSNG